MAKILVIEDVELVQNTYKRMFRQHELHMVTNGLAALEILEEGQFDLIISDGDLEGDLTGMDVWKWVEINRKDMISKFLFCSGNDDMGRECEKLGVPYQDKAEPRALMQRVKNMLEVRS